MFGSNLKPGGLLAELFPTKQSGLVFALYIVLFVNQGILVKASQGANNQYDFNIISVVIMSECLKLFICIGVYLNERSPVQLVRELRDGIQIGFLYLIPALLYCFYNNLAFINLRNYDPTTYFILLQLRNVITGLFFEILFHKKLTKLQWFSLILLTIGCAIKELGRTGQNAESLNLFQAFFSWNLMLIIVQILCSCFAGVYNEYLIKDTGSSVHILVHNIFMYLNSIFCNIVLQLLERPFSGTPITLDFSFLTKPYVGWILVNGALAGITTSLFLKNLNSIVKNFAATIEIILSAILCSFIFGQSIDSYTIVSIIMVVISIIIYLLKPVKNMPVIKLEKIKQNGEIESENSPDHVKLLIRD